MCWLHERLSIHSGDVKVEYSPQLATTERISIDSDFAAEARPVDLGAFIGRMEGAAHQVLVAGRESIVILIRSADDQNRCLHA